jgi:hypothetical protein
MNSESESKNPGEADDKLPSMEEFGEWLKADPKNFEEWAVMLERFAQDESAPPEVRAAARQTLAKRREARCLDRVQRLFVEILTLMQRPAGSMAAEDRLSQCNALMDEVTDALLETPEPHRTKFLKVLVPMREQVRALKVED